VPSKKNLTTKPNKPSDYSDFLRGIALIGLGLQDCRSKIDREAYGNSLQKKKSERLILTDYKLGKSYQNFFDVTAYFILTVSDAKKKPSNVLTIECTYGAHFHCDECEDHREYAQRFAESELRLVMWPYFRQFVNDMTGRMTIPPIFIPFHAGQIPSSR
jgi:hypothetical protein